MKCSLLVFELIVMGLDTSFMIQNVYPIAIFICLS